MHAVLGCGARTHGGSVLMPSLYLAQLLCPARHALCGLAYDREKTTPGEIDLHLRAVINSGVLNPWCGLCGSRELHVEHGKLKTDNWEEAQADLHAGEAAQLLTRAYFDQHRN